MMGMATQTRLVVRPAEDRDRRQLTNLIHFETYVHRHLDWRQPLDWLGHQPYYVAEDDGGLLAALACPPDPPHVAWVRTFAVSSRTAPSEAWSALWPQVQQHLEEQAQGNEVSVAAIPLQAWLENILIDSAFTRTHDVIVLARDEARRIKAKLSGEFTIRPMRQDDLEAVHRVDVAAFEPVWQNSLNSLQLAFQQTAVATVALQAERVVGYQISTPSPLGAHLARLAVHPDAQRKGVGLGLINDLLEHYRNRQPRRITVNTQHNNRVSLSLYKKAGFKPTGERYPVYQFILS